MAEIEKTVKKIRLDQKITETTANTYHFETDADIVLVDRGSSKYNGLATNVQDALEEIEDNLSAEQGRATAAENKLTNDLAKEVTDRTQAISNLSTQVNADLSTLDDKVDAEILRAKAAEADLTSAINTEATTRETAIQTEATARTNTDTALQNALAEEVTNRNAAITVESNRAKAAESTLTSNLTKEANRAKGVEEDLENAIVAEKNRAEAAENNLQLAIDDVDNRLSTESTNRAAGDNTLNTKLDNEIARAEAAESGLQTDLSDLETEINETIITKLDELETKIDTDISEAIQTEVEAREAADTQLSIDLSAETTRATNAESTLTTNLNTEITNRTNAINTEAAARTAADEALASDISSTASDLSDETSRAMTAETALETKFEGLLDYNVHIETPGGTEITYVGDLVTKNSNYRNLKTETTGTRSEVIGLANSTTAGLMSFENFNLLADVNERVSHIEGKASRLLYDISSNPTAQDIADFVEAHPEYEEKDYPGVAVVVQTTNHIWRYYANQTPSWVDEGVDVVVPFTAVTPGIIISSNVDGKVQAAGDGTGAVVGWSTVKNDISNLQSDLASETSARTNAVANEVTARTNADNTLQGNIDTLDTSVNTRLDTLESKINTEISKAIADEADERAEADAVLLTNISSISDNIDTLTTRLYNDTTGNLGSIPALNKRIDDLDLSTVGEDGKYIKTVSQAEGQLAATFGTFDTSIPTLNPSEITAPTTKAVKTYVDGEVSHTVSDLGGAISNLTNSLYNDDPESLGDIPALTARIDNLDLAQVGAAGSYIKLVSQVEGLLSATPQPFDTSIGAGASDNNAPTSLAVKTFVSTEIGKLDATHVGDSLDPATNGKYICAISETDGVISATAKDFITDLSVAASKTSLIPPTSAAVEARVSALTYNEIHNHPEFEYDATTKTLTITYSD